MIGVSFQPGSDGFGQQNGNGRPSGGSGVQEAIKILSLRLPRVVGAQGISPMPLLTSQGSGGNPRVDSIVNQVLSRMMPNPSRPQGVSGPNFSGASTPSYQPPMQSPWQPPTGFTPRVVVDQPRGLPTGTDADLSGAGQPPGMFDPVPTLPQMPGLQQAGWDRGTRQPQQEYPENPFEMPLF